MDNRAPRDGAYLESLGYYHPIEKDSGFKIDLQRYEEWVKNGAKVSNIVRDIAKRMGKKAST